jgi:hypothetical protein
LKNFYRIAERSFGVSDACNDYRHLPTIESKDNELDMMLNWFQLFLSVCDQILSESSLMLVSNWLAVSSTALNENLS